MSEKDALAALTTTPAKEFGQPKRLGKVAPGFIANLVVTNGDYFDETSKVNAVWIDGYEHELSPDPIVSVDGDWMLKEGDNNWTLSIKDGKGELKSDETSIKLAKLNVAQDRITFSVKSDTILQSGVTRFNGSITDKEARGHVVYADGNKGSWSATFD